MKSLNHNGTSDVKVTSNTTPTRIRAISASTSSTTTTTRQIAAINPYSDKYIFRLLKLKKIRDDHEQQRRHNHLFSREYGGSYFSTATFNKADLHSSQSCFGTSSHRGSSAIPKYCLDEKEHTKVHTRLNDSIDDSRRSINSNVSKLSYSKCRSPLSPKKQVAFKVYKLDDASKQKMNDALVAAEKESRKRDEAVVKNKPWLASSSSNSKHRLVNKSVAKADKLNLAYRKVAWPNWIESTAIDTSISLTTLANHVCTSGSDSMIGSNGYKYFDNLTSPLKLSESLNTVKLSDVPLQLGLLSPVQDRLLREHTKRWNAVAVAKDDISSRLLLTCYVYESYLASDIIDGMEASSLCVLALHPVTTRKCLIDAISLQLGSGKILDVEILFDQHLYMSLYGRVVKKSRQLHVIMDDDDSISFDQDSIISIYYQYDAVERKLRSSWRQLLSQTYIESDYLVDDTHSTTSTGSEAANNSVNGVDDLPEYELATETNDDTVDFISSIIATTHIDTSINDAVDKVSTESPVVTYKSTHINAHTVTHEDIQLGPQIDAHIETNLGTSVDITVSDAAGTDVPTDALTDTDTHAIMHANTKSDTPIDKPKDSPTSMQIGIQIGMHGHTSTDDITGAAADTAIDAPTDALVEAATHVDESVNTRINTHIGIHDDTPIDDTADKVADIATDLSTDTSISTQIDIHIDKQIDIHIDKQIDKHIDKQIDMHEDTPVDDSVSEGVDTVVDAPTDVSTEKDTHLDVNANPHMNTQINEHIDPLILMSASADVKKSTDVLSKNAKRKKKSKHTLKD